MMALVGWSQVEGRSHVTACVCKSLILYVSASICLVALVASLLFRRKGPASDS